jgi:hypothetical protein
MQGAGGSSRKLLSRTEVADLGLFARYLAEKAADKRRGAAAMKDVEIRPKLWMRLKARNFPVSCESHFGSVDELQRRIIQGISGV